MCMCMSMCMNVNVDMAACTFHGQAAVIHDAMHDVMHGAVHGAMHLAAEVCDREEKLRSRQVCDHVQPG